jgi:hypothetical protein
MPAPTDEEMASELGLLMTARNRVRKQQAIVDALAEDESATDYDRYKADAQLAVDTGTLAFVKTRVKGKIDEY